MKEYELMIGEGRKQEGRPARRDGGEFFVSPLCRRLTEKEIHDFWRGYGMPRDKEYR